MTKPINELSDTELREAVAVEVVRWRLDDGDWLLDNPHSGTNGGIEMPCYELDIEAAFEAIDKARTKKCYVEVIAMGFGYLITWQVFGDVSDCILDAGTIKVKFLSEVPRAICIATLTAVRARKA